MARPPANPPAAPPVPLRAPGDAGTATLATGAFAAAGTGSPADPGSATMTPRRFGSSASGAPRSEAVVAATTRAFGSAAGGSPRSPATAATDCVAFVAVAGGTPRSPARGDARPARFEATASGAPTSPGTAAMTMSRFAATAGHVDADFATALRRRLLLEPALADLDDVYWNRPIGVPAYPYLVVERLNEVPVLNTSDSWYEEVDLQFTAYAHDDGTAERLGLAAWDAMRPVAANPPLAWPGGSEVVRLPGARRGPDELPGQGPGGQDVWTYGFDVLIFIGKG